MFHSFAFRSASEREKSVLSFLEKCVKFMLTERIGQGGSFGPLFYIILTRYNILNSQVE